jgi:hypothetical protein
MDTRGHRTAAQLERLIVRDGGHGSGIIVPVLLSTAGSLNVNPRSTIMVITKLWVFDKFSDAENARIELLAFGLSSDKVRLDVREDEAGPVEGNFTVGNATAADDASNPIKSLLAGDDHTYEHDYAKVEQRGVYLLTVDASDDDQIILAYEITGRFGAIDVSERTSRRTFGH